MTQITEHDGKQEWKSYYCVWCRIHFAIARYSVGINQHLICMCEFIRVIVRWRCFGDFKLVYYR